MGLLIHPAAAEEAAAAYSWYRERSPRTAASFLTELDRLIARIETRSDAGPEFRHGTRRLPFRKFPFLLVYRAAADHVQVIAVAHGKQRPGYWRSRT